MSLAIIGAGLSGLAAAHALRDADLPITIFEKSRGVSGRAATRRREGVCYDHGANYFKTEDEQVEALVRGELPAEDLVQIEPDVWTFDEGGTLAPGDPEHNQEAKWTYRDGISRLGKLLATDAGAEVGLQTRIAFFERADDGWHLTDVDGDSSGPFDALLLTPPAPQTADLLRASSLDDGLQQPLVEALASAPYRTQLALVLAYEERIERPGDFYALLNTDGAHEVAWLGFEEDKPGHLSEEAAVQSLLVAQMAPAWSRPRFRSDLGALVPEGTALIGSLLNQKLGAPAWADKQGWKYALPEAAADADALEEGAASGLFFAGDALAGEGRVEAALRSGLEAAERLRDFFS